MDLVILDSGCTDIVSGLRALAQCLVRRSLATGIQVGIGYLTSVGLFIHSFKEALQVSGLLTCPSDTPLQAEPVLPMFPMSC